VFIHLDTSDDCFEERSYLLVLDSLKLKRKTLMNSNNGIAHFKYEMPA